MSNQEFNLQIILEREINSIQYNMRFFTGFPAPPSTDLTGYHTYIDEMLPSESPYLYGLHPNAEVGFLTMTSENLFKTVFEMQPRDAASSGGQTVTREDKVLIKLQKIK